MIRIRKLAACFTGLAALSLASDSAGATRKVHTTVLLSVAEAMDAMARAKPGTYTPPA